MLKIQVPVNLVIASVLTQSSKGKLTLMGHCHESVAMVTFDILTEVFPWQSSCPDSHTRSSDLCPFSYPSGALQKYEESLIFLNFHSNCLKITTRDQCDEMVVMVNYFDAGKNILMKFHLYLLVQIIIEWNMFYCKGKVHS